MDENIIGYLRCMIAEVFSLTFFRQNLRENYWIRPYDVCVYFFDSLQRN